MSSSFAGAYLLDITVMIKEMENDMQNKKKRILIY